MAQLGRWHFCLKTFILHLLPFAALRVQFFVLLSLCTQWLLYLESPKDVAWPYYSCQPKDGHKYCISNHVSHHDSLDFFLVVWLHILEGALEDWIYPLQIPTNLGPSEFNSCKGLFWFVVLLVLLLFSTSTSWLTSYSLSLSLLLVLLEWLKLLQWQVSRDKLSIDNQAAIHTEKF